MDRKITPHNSRIFITFFFHFYRLSYRGDRNWRKDGRPHYRNFGTMVDWIPGDYKWQSDGSNSIPGYDKPISDPPNYYKGFYSKKHPLNGGTEPSLDPNQVYGIYKGGAQRQTWGRPSYYPRLMTGKQLTETYQPSEVIFGRTRGNQDLTAFGDWGRPSYCSYATFKDMSSCREKT